MQRSPNNRANFSGFSRNIMPLKIQYHVYNSLTWASKTQPTPLHPTSLRFIFSFEIMLALCGAHYYDCHMENSCFYWGVQGNIQFQHILQSYREKPGLDCYLLWQLAHYRSICGCQIVPATVFCLRCVSKCDALSNPHLEFCKILTSSILSCNYSHSKMLQVHIHALWSPVASILAHYCNCNKTIVWRKYENVTTQKTLLPACHKITIFVSIPELSEATAYIIIPYQSCPSWHYS